MIIHKAYVQLIEVNMDLFLRLGIFKRILMVELRSKIGFDNLPFKF